MLMTQTLAVLNQMVADKVIEKYAIGGAVAAYNYIEPTLTEDLDILVSFENVAPQSGLVLLTPIINYLRKKGYSEFRAEGIVISGWPVQFLPAASPLDAEALDEAVEIDVGGGADGVRTRVLSAEHVMATALSVGRPKDYSRITQFIEADAYNSAKLCAILDRHGLNDKWSAFCYRFEISDPCNMTRKP